MKRVISTFVLGLFLGCIHPEKQEYERDKKVNQEEVRNVGNKLSKEEGAPALDMKDNVAGSDILKMENENGVKYVWVEINGIRLRFIFDTGASSICISPAEATVLYRQGTLRRGDILDKEYFQDATGKISEGTTIKLRKVKIGNRVLENIQATIIDNENAPLLLGQSVFERFGKIEIDNVNEQIIFK